MNVFMFMTRFAANVAGGDKPCTIRPERERLPVVGEPVSLRRWEGVAYRSKQIELRRAYISRVRPLRFDKDGFLYLKGRRVFDPEHENLARLDGFENAMEMRVWFHEQHGLPFTGIFVEWDDVPRLHEGGPAERTLRGAHNNITFEVLILAIRGKHAMVKSRGCCPTVAALEDLRALPCL